MGDAANDIGVIVAAAIMQWSDSPHRFYADPAVSLVIAVGIVILARPLGKSLCWRVMSEY